MQNNKIRSESMLRTLRFTVIQNFQKRIQQHIGRALQDVVDEDFAQQQRLQDYPQHRHENPVDQQKSIELE